LAEQLHPATGGRNGSLDGTLRRPVFQPLAVETRESDELVIGVRSALPEYTCRPVLEDGEVGVGSRTGGNEAFARERGAFIVAHANDEVRALRTFRAGPQKPIAVIAASLESEPLDGAGDG